MIHYISAAVAAFLIVVLVVLYYCPAFTADKHETSFQVKEDMTARDIGDELQREGLISSATLFRLAASVSGNGSQIKQGTYVLDSHMSMSSLFAKLTSGKSEAMRLVIPEGYTVQQIAKQLEKQEIVSADDFLAEARKTDLLYAYMKGNRVVTFPTEGFLFPDTYFIPAGATASDIIKLMLDNFDHQLTPDLRKEIDGHNMSIYQFVTLASLVEKEAKYEADREPIAAVFYKRLKINMPLQSDASISYAMGTYKAAYSIEETKYDSPYNTYQNTGLPPGPIANPGMDCIKAAADAQDTEYLFFVADSSGHNHFSTTYEEHLKNVEEYGQ